MLGKHALLRAITARDIGISYEYNLLNGLPTRLPAAVKVVPDDPDSIATRIFLRHFFGDRLALTLGPVVVSDSIRRLQGRHQFKGRPNHFDLTMSGGEIDIMPGESFATHSMEFVSCNFKYAAYILPRLTLATSGLVVIPTYIDPYWEGILQLFITNLSKRPYSLRSGERIAICRFYEVTGATPNAITTSEFAQKSHHYGLNWTRLIDTDAEIQPRGKREVPSSVYIDRIRTRFFQFLTHWNNIVGVAAGATLVAAIFAYAKFDSRAVQIDGLATQVQDLKTKVDKFPSEHEYSGPSVAESGILRFSLMANQDTLSQNVPLGNKTLPGSGVWAFAGYNDPVAIRSQLVCGASSCKIRIEVQRVTGKRGTINTQIRWLIVSE